MTNNGQIKSQILSNLLILAALFQALTVRKDISLVI